MEPSLNHEGPGPAAARRRLEAYFRISGVDRGAVRSALPEGAGEEEVLGAAIEEGRKEIREVVRGLGPFLPPPHPGVMPAQPIEGLPPVLRAKWWRHVLRVALAPFGGAVRLLRVIVR